MPRNAAVVDQRTRLLRQGLPAEFAGGMPPPIVAPQPIAAKIRNVSAASKQPSSDVRMVSAPCHLSAQCAVNSHTLAQMPLTRHEVGLDSDAIRVLEQGGVVAGRPVVFLRSPNDLGGELQRRPIDRVDIFAASCAEAQVMKSSTPLAEGVFEELGSGGRDGDTRAPTDTVEDLRRVHECDHLQRVQKLLVERYRLLHARDGELNVRNAIYAGQGPDSKLTDG